MRILFRVDASTVIGAGHVSRCTTLARALHGRGHEVVFLQRALPGNHIERLRESGFLVWTLPPPGPNPIQTHSIYSTWLGVSWEADSSETRERLSTTGPWDWVVVDHYALDHRWEKIVGNCSRLIMAIDDLADRQHYVDLLLDQVLHPDSEARYADLVPRNCRVLLGPRYALLRPQFREARLRAPERRTNPRRFLVFLGGADPENVTQKVLESIARSRLGPPSTDVVVGHSNPNRSSLEAWVSNAKWCHLHIEVNDMATLMSRADLAIGAGGMATWERLCLSLPALVITVADNQVPIANAVADQGAIRYLGRADEVSAADLTRALDEIRESPGSIREMAAICGTLVDGLGVERVVDAMEALGRTGSPGIAAGPAEMEGTQ